MKIINHYLKLLKRYSYEFLFMIYLKDNPFKILNLNWNLLNPKFISYYFRVVIYGNISDDIVSNFTPYMKKVIYSSKSCYEHYYITEQTSVIPDRYINLIVSRLASECIVSNESLSDRVMWISSNLSVITYNKIKSSL